MTSPLRCVLRRLNRSRIAIAAQTPWGIADTMQTIDPVLIQSIFAIVAESHTCAKYINTVSEKSSATSWGLSGYGQNLENK